MNLLLDTHVFLWAVGDPSRLPRRVSAAVTSRQNLLYVSMATVLELGIHVSTERLRLDGPLLPFFNRQMRMWGAHLLDITIEHAVAISVLPVHHRDPFDRLLVAQAQAEDLVLVSGDETIAKYAVSILWD